MLTQPFARTNSYFHSFVPDSVRQWNSLPEHVFNNSSFHLLNNPFFITLIVPTASSLSSLSLLLLLFTVYVFVFVFVSGYSLN